MSAPYPSDFLTGGVIGANGGGGGHSVQIHTPAEQGHQQQQQQQQQQQRGLGGFLPAGADQKLKKMMKLNERRVSTGPMAANGKTDRQTRRTMWGKKKVQF